MLVFFFIRDTRVSTIEYKNLDSILTSSDSFVSSHVLSVSVQRVIGNSTNRMEISGTDGAIILVLKTFVNQVSELSNQRSTYRSHTLWSH